MSDHTMATEEDSKCKHILCFGLNSCDIEARGKLYKEVHKDRLAEKRKRQDEETKEDEEAEEETPKAEKKKRAKKEVAAPAAKEDKKKEEAEPKEMKKWYARVQIGEDHNELWSTEAVNAEAAHQKFWDKLAAYFEDYADVNDFQEFLEEVIDGDDYCTTSLQDAAQEAVNSIDVKRILSYDDMLASMFKDEIVVD